MWLLTFHGLERYAEDDETRTPDQDIKDWKNNGQTLVPIPHGPCL